jgi:hypothetical protein
MTKDDWLFCLFMLFGTFGKNATGAFLITAQHRPLLSSP